MHATAVMNKALSKNQAAMSSALESDNQQGEPLNVLAGISPQKQMVFSTGDILYYMGENNASVFYLQSGMVKLLTHLPNGSHRVVRVAANGDFIGFDCLINGFQRYTAVAMDDMAVTQLQANGLMLPSKQSVFMSGNWVPASPDLPGPGARAWRKLIGWRSGLFSRPFSLYGAIAHMLLR